MRVAYTVAMLLAVLLFVEPSLAGALDDAMAAYRQRDYTTALRLLQPLAQKGDPFAQYTLGFMYAFGQGIRQNNDEALNWYRKAADSDYAAAQYQLGLAYANGKGVPKNDTVAATWYRKAANHNFMPAEFLLGVAYAYGKGLTQNDIDAASWYRKAAIQGFAEAQVALGELLMHGGKSGAVPLNQSEAVQWFRRAADQNDASAQAQLGIAYTTGDGVPADKVFAYTWLNLASRDQGLIGFTARTGRKLLERGMTSAEIGEAQKLTREWRPRKSRLADTGVTAPPTSALPSQPRETEVPLQIAGGVFVVPVELNGAIKLNFAVDSGASDVTVSSDVFSTLKRTGTVKDSDLRGVQTYILADGSRSNSPEFTIRSLRVGDVVLKNVAASVSPSQGMLLLGQSFLSRFKLWSIDNTNHELHLEVR